MKGLDVKSEKNVGKMSVDLPSKIVNFVAFLSLFVDGTCQAKEFHKSIHQSNNQVPQISGQL